MINKEVLAKRVYSLRCSHKINQTQLGEIAGISQFAISKIEKAQRAASIEVLISLADYFSVSLDYLTGRTDCPDIVTKDKDGRFIAIEAMQPPQTAAKEDVARIANEIIKERKDAFKRLSK